MFADIDFQSLKLAWWVLMAVLLGGVMIMDGFCSGVLAMMPFIGKDDVERRVAINSIGPIWEANQVWLILFGGALFAAWPMAYAVICSSFYLAVFLLLLSLIARPVGFKMRSKVDSARWRNGCDFLLFFGGIIPPFLLGVIFGNCLIGIGFHLDAYLRPMLDGGSILHPFALSLGVLNTALSLRQGALYLYGKSDGAVSSRAKNCFYFFNFAFISIYTIMALCLPYLKGYLLVSPIDQNMPPNPIGKIVAVVVGGWSKRYMDNNLLYIFPSLCFISFFLSHIFMRCKKALLAFFAGALGVLGVVFSVGAAMYPFFIPSLSAPSHSLLIWDSSSSLNTLCIMTVVAVIFLPCILAYTAWVYMVFNYKVTSLSIVNAKKNEVY